MIIQDIDTIGTFVIEFFVQKHMTLAWKRVDKTKSYISKSDVH